MPWAPAIGIVAGTLTGGLVLGIYDTQRILDAPWIGVPGEAYIGFDLSFGPEFWALLPAFVMVTLVGAMDTLGDSIAIQRISWRKQRSTDFRSIQGAIAADGLGNLLSGVSGTVPNTTYGMSISIAELTGVAARSVGVCVGLIFILFAFLPKLVAAIVAIPGPVAASFLIVVIALIRRKRIRVGLNPDAYIKLDTFLSEFAAQRKWSDEMTVRIRAVGEETLNILMGHTVEHQPDLERRLLLIVHDDGGAADLEFIAATDEANLEDRMVALGNWATGGSIEEMPLRLLRHYAASVRHQQYYDTDVVTVRVESVSAA